LRRAKGDKQKKRENEEKGRERKRRNQKKSCLESTREFFFKLSGIRSVDLLIRDRTDILASLTARSKKGLDSRGRDGKMGSYAELHWQSMA